MKRLGVVATLIMIFGAQNGAVRAAVMDETAERQVDQAALEAQERATSQLTELLIRHRGSQAEVELLGRYADALSETAAIEFRIAHGRAHRKGTPLELDNYHRTLKRAISAWSEEITRFSSSKGIVEAYFGRAKAEEELGLKESAESDYEVLVSKFQGARVAVSATLSLADLAIEKSEFAKAIRQLSSIEKQADDPHYPLALYKIAWSYYNLRDIPHALAYLEKNIDYYHLRNGGSTVEKATLSSVSDAALRENSLLDAAIFVFEGFEQKKSRFGLPGVLQYFGGLKPGPVLDKMVLRYAKLLRSHGHEAALVLWKNLCLGSDSQINDSTRREILLITFQDQLNQRRYPELVATAHELAKYGAATQLLDAAELLQKDITKNKNADDVGILNTAASGIYDAFTKTVSPGDPRLSKIHYNLGEAYFQTRNYEAASVNYRWILEHAGSVPADPTLLKEASAKAISSRYELLREKGLIPKELAARSLATKPTLPGVQGSELLLQWVAWVDAHWALYPGALYPGSIANFYFEANRGLYALGNISQAALRFEEFAVHNPLSSFASPSAALVLDTIALSENWPLLKQKIDRFQAVMEWKNTELGRRLAVQAAEVMIKIATSNYKNGHFDLALIQSEKALAEKGLERNTDRQELIVLAGNAAVALRRLDKALLYYSQLIDQNPQGGEVHGKELKMKALLARAKLYESAEGSFQFSSVARDYRSYVSLSAHGVKQTDLQKRILLFAWLSDEPGLLAKFLADPGVCTEATTMDCDRYHAALALGATEAPAQGLVQHALAKARRGFAENSAIWAAVALRGAKHLGFRDCSLTLEILGTRWSSLDPLVAPTLLSSISRSIGLALEMNRQSVSEISPLVGVTGRSERYIQDRMFRIHEFEAAAAQVGKLPWARIQAMVLNQTAEVYLDAAKSLQDVKLAEPFEEKGQDLRARAFQIASKSGIEEDTFSLIATSFFKDNPSQAKRLGFSRPFARPRALDPFTLDALGEVSKPGDQEIFARKLREQWAASLGAEQWQRVGYYLRIAREKSLLSPGLLALMQATSWVAMGAQSEGLRELADARAAGLPVKTQANISLFLMAHFMASFSRERTKILLDDYRKMTGNPVEKNPTSVAAVAAQWMGG